ncbi:MAG TPA: hypothetical protein VFI33_12465 [Puia sp.]|nr:hypothetical protein [Puia sp.]
MKPAIYRRRLAVPGLILLLSSFSLNVFSQPLDHNDFVLLRMNEVNARAARHFMENFTPSSTVKWFRDDLHYVATFTEGDSTDRVYYKSNGNFDYCLKYYRADALEPYLKSIVFKKFPGCEILTVTEITDLETKELSIKIKDGSYIRTLSCSDEGIEITEDFRDSNS